MEQQAGAMPRALQNAGQDNRLTRMILRDGAAGPDDLKRMREYGRIHLSINCQFYHINLVKKCNYWEMKV